MTDKFSIVKELYIEASNEKVFDALTKSDQIIKYFPLTEVISDWAVGSEVLYKGEVDGVQFTDFGIIENLLPPTQYSYHYWSDNHGTANVPENRVTISYHLSNRENGTKLIVEQQNLPSPELYELMNNVVWDSLLVALKKYVESDAQ